MPRFDGVSGPPAIAIDGTIVAGDVTCGGSLRFVRGTFFFFSSRRRHTRFKCDWSSDVCSSDLIVGHCRPARVTTTSATAPPRLSTGTWYGAQVCTAWRVRRVLTGEGPGEVAGVKGPACGGCGHVDRLITWPDSRRRDRSSGLEQARSASAAL